MNWRGHTMRTTETIATALNALTSAAEVLGSERAYYLIGTLVDIALKAGYTVYRQNGTWIVKERECQG